MSRASTVAVAVVLLLFAALVGGCAGLLRVGIPHRLLQCFSYALSLGLIGRAMGGDFKYVGFFKRIRGMPFARLDSLVFSPVCLLLAAGAGWSAMRSVP